MANGSKATLLIEIVVNREENGEENGAGSFFGSGCEGFGWDSRCGKDGIETDREDLVGPRVPVLGVARLGRGTWDHALRCLYALQSPEFP